MDEDLVEVGTLEEEGQEDGTLDFLTALARQTTGQTGGRVTRTSRITLPAYPGQGADAEGVTVIVDSWHDYSNNGGLELKVEGQPHTSEEWLHAVKLIESIVSNR